MTASARKPKPPVPRWRWAVWLAVLVPALVVFYVLLTPVWVGIRVTRWLSARRDGLRPPDRSGQTCTLRPR